MLTSSDHADRFLKLAHRGCLVVTHRSIEARGLVLFKIRGYRITQAKYPVGTSRLQAIRILTRTRRLKNRSTTPERKSPEIEGLLPETLKRLRVQFVDVEVFSSSTVSA
jgi:hypothetical protein